MRNYLSPNPIQYNDTKSAPDSDVKIFEYIASRPQACDIHSPAYNRTADISTEDAPGNIGGGEGENPWF